LVAWGERLAWGRGYVVHVLPFADAPLAPGEAAITQLNQALEALVRQHPDQYLWGYARYKAPLDEAGA
jgi:KDO2-lipid IV(A) lauroyltransferase